MMIIGGIRCGDRHEWWEWSVRSAASNNRSKTFAVAKIFVVADGDRALGLTMESVLVDSALNYRLLPHGSPSGGGRRLILIYRGTNWRSRTPVQGSIVDGTKSAARAIEI